MLWNVAYADCVLDHEEDMLVWQIAGLIHVTDKGAGLGAPASACEIIEGRALILSTEALLVLVAHF